MDALARALAPIVPAEGTEETVDASALSTAEDVTPWISVEREALRNHLRQIYTSGISPDVVFERDLRVTALSKDQALFLTSPSPETQVFPWRVGMKTKQVGKWRRALGKFSDEEVQVHLRLHTPEGQQTKSDAGRGLPHQHVEIHDGERLTLAFPTLLSPREAEARIGTHEAGQVLEAVDEGTVHPLPREICRSVRTARRTTGAMEIWLRVRSGGSEIQVGAKTGQFSVVPFPQLEAQAEYDLLLQADALSSALKSVRNWDDAHLVLTGSESIIAVCEGGWTYVLSPLA